MGRTGRRCGGSRGWGHTAGQRLEGTRLRRLGREEGRSGWDKRRVWVVTDQAGQQYIQTTEQGHREARKEQQVLWKCEVLELLQAQKQLLLQSWDQLGQAHW